MKVIRNSGIVLSVLIVMVGLVLSFTACTQQSPMTTELSSKRELNIVKFGNGTVSLKKVVSVSQWVTEQDGGKLSLEYEGVEAKITLKVFPGAISEDAELTLNLDDQYLDVTFNPHGITFDPPALLNIEVANLDLSGIDPDQINIHYDNPETGQWEIVPSYNIIVDAEAGYLRVVDAQLPHFSRYAIGYGE